MSVLQIPVRRPSSVAPAEVSRLLLLCQFDFRQKSWGLPVWESRRDRDHIFPSDAGALLSAVAQKLPEFFISSSRRPTVSRPATRRTSFRRSRPQSLGNAKTKTKEKKSNFSNQRSRDAGGETSSLSALPNQQPFLKT